MLRERISSSLTELNNLSIIHDWIPNEFTIRPTAKDLEEKRRQMAIIESTWPTIKDYILHSVFEGSVISWIFKPSMFRYALPSYSNHYVLWHKDHNFNFNFDDETVNEMINTQIKKIVGHENYMFAWYKNPKPTVIDFWHVQVFWTAL